MLIVMITLEPRVAAMRMAPPTARMRRVFLLAGFMGRLSPGCLTCPWERAGWTLVLTPDCGGPSARGETAPHARFVGYQRSSVRNVMLFAGALPLVPPSQAPSSPRTASGPRFQRAPARYLRLAPSASDRPV